MENEELNELIINNYLEYLDEELLDDNIENIDIYISTLWYDLMDNIELDKEMFGIEQDVDDFEAAKNVENMIREILTNR